MFRVRDSNSGQRRAVKVLIDPSSNTAKQSFQREWDILDSKDLPGKTDGDPLVAPQFYFGDETAGAQPFLDISVTSDFLRNACV